MGVERDAADAGAPGNHRSRSLAPRSVAKARTAGKSQSDAERRHLAERGVLTVVSGLTVELIRWSASLRGDLRAREDSSVEVIAERDEDGPLIPPSD
jgi:hypothetical protein